MKRIVLILIVNLLLIKTPAFADVSRGIYASVIDTVTNQPQRVKLYDKAYAVIIGIDKYPKLKANMQLKNAVNDAQAVEKTIKKRFIFDKVFTLYNEQATHKAIMQLLTVDLRKIITADDALFLFWAGHGNQETTADGDLGYLITYDGDSDGINGNVTMGQFRDDISKFLKAKHIFYVFDACYSGLLATRSSGDGPTPHSLDYLRYITSERVRQVLTAGRKGETTLDEGPGGHSIFSGNLIRTLEKADDYITAKDLSLYFPEKVYQDAKARNHQQTPDFGRLSGMGDFVFVPNVEQMEGDIKAGLIRAEAELKALDDLEARAKMAAIKKQQTEQKRLAVFDKIKNDQISKQKLAQEARTTDLKAEKEKLAALRAELEQKKRNTPVAPDTLQGAAGEIKRLKDEIAGSEIAFARLRLEVGDRYDQVVKAFDFEKRDEFEKEQVFNARIKTEKNQAELDSRNELALLDSTLSSETAIARAEIKRLSEKEYLLDNSMVTLEFGLYDPEKEVIKATIKSSGKNLFKIDITGTISLPPLRARSFKQQWQSGLVRPEVAVRVNGDVVRIAIANDAENYLLVYENFEFLTAEEKRRRQKEEKVKQAEAAKTTEELVKRLKTLGIEMQNVKGGCFKMGDLFNLRCRGLHSEHPIHDVCVDDFLIGKYEVTQGLWKKIMGSNPSKFSSCGNDCPVNNVNWEDVQKFLKKLNTATRGNFRLPTEAEWEYACRSGGRLERYCGSSDADAVAWHEGNSSEKIHKIGLKKPNGLGLFDMSGNVFELVKDRSGQYTAEPQYNPVGPTTGDGRIIRGGSYQVIEGGSVVGAACRVHQFEEERDPFVGFRLAASVMTEDNSKNKTLPYSREIFDEDKKNLTSQDWFDMASALLEYNLTSTVDKVNTTQIIEYLSESIRLSPEFANAYYERAKVYKKSKEYNLSIQDYTRAMTLFKEDNSEFIWALEGRADVYYEIKDYEKAIKDCSTLVKLRNHERFYEKRGEVYYEMKKYHLAAEDFTKQIEISPNVKSYINRGNANYNIGNFGLAIDDYSFAIALNPTDHAGISNRGRAYYNIGKYKEAIEDLEIAKKQTNNDVDDLMTLGLAYYKAGNLAEGCHSFKAACNLGNCTEYKSLCKITAP